MVQQAFIWLLWFAITVVFTSTASSSSITKVKLQQYTLSLHQAQTAEDIQPVLQQLQHITIHTVEKNCQHPDCLSSEAKAYKKAVSELSVVLAKTLRRWPQEARTITKMMQSWQYTSKPIRLEKATKEFEKAVQIRANVYQKTMQYSKLLALAIKLRDAPTKKTVLDVIGLLQQANTSLFGLPCEDLYCQTSEPTVHAATIDALLAGFAHNIQRWPDLRPIIGATVLSWQYCNIRYRNRNHDLIYKGKHQRRIAASRPSPVHQQGWQQWGFDIHNTANRLIPYPLQHHGLRGRAEASFLHRYVQQRCMPDPITGRTPYDPVDGIYYGSIHQIPEEIGGDYPYARQWALQEKKTIAPRQPKQHKTVAVTEYKTVTIMDVPLPKIKTRTKRKRVIKTRNKKDSPQPKSKKTTTKIIPQALAKAVLATVPTSVHPIGIRHDIQKSETVEPNDPYTQTTAAVTTSHIQGGSYTKWKMGSRQQELGIAALWTPFDYFYVRGGLSTRIPNWGSKPAYTWGLGYNDWHAGGWAVELNQWTAQPLGSSPNILSAEFNLGYRIPFSAVWEPYISGTLNVKVVGKTPKLGGLWQVKYKTYFVRFGIQKNLRGPNGWQWVYGFGRWDWRAGSINLEYANWGVNKTFQKNFRKNGELMLEYRWDY